MLKVISWSIIGFVYNLFCCYVFCKLTSEKFEFNKRVFIITSFFSLINCYSIYYMPQIRIILSNVCEMIILLTLYQKNFILTLILELYIFLLLAISEVVFVTLFIGLFKVNGDFLQNTALGILCTNIVIMFICYIFFLISTKKFLKIEIEKWKYNQNFNNIALYFLSIVTIIFLMYPLFNYEINLSQIICFSVLTLFCIYFIFGFFSQKNGNLKLRKEYDNLVMFSKIYEKLIDEKSKEQHENRNQLLIIKSMIDSKNKNVSTYIDKLLNIDTENKDLNYLTRLKNFPDGLKGLVYYKIEEMKKLGIDVFVYAPNRLSKNDAKIFENCLKDISRIIGVYLDNAKEAAKICDSKFVVIEFNVDKDIVFNISNTYNENNIDRIGIAGFTTKGRGHGHGLSLVSDILKENKNFEATTSIDGRYYNKSLKITLKKD